MVCVRAATPEPRASHEMLAFVGCCDPASYTVSDFDGNVEFGRMRFPHIKRKVAIAYGLCCAVSSY